jgi:hypothetical protein
MAQMPRGNPRSVPDPAGDQYDEIFRQERLKRDREEASANELRSWNGGWNAGLFPRVTDQFTKPRDLRLERTVQIGGQTYEAVDNGQVTVLVPVDDPAEAAKLADQRQAINRALFIANNPIGAVGYGLATLAGASPETRDRALATGAVADTAMLSATPRGAPVRKPAPPQRAQPVSPPLMRPNIRNRELNANGQATGINATVTTPMLGTGTRARPNPPGWSGHSDDHNEARSHLLAKVLGGSGTDRRNLVTLTHNGANTPQMRDFELGVARRVRAGEVVEYSATPLYRPGVLPPSHLLLTAYGSRGAPIARIIQNPAGNRR